jgi:MYXO-CTERM domain-containing protein
VPTRLFAPFLAIWAFRRHLRHAPFVLALAGGAALRWTAVLAYPHGLWFTGDSYFYLGYALRPAPSPSKTLGYSFALRLLEPLHSLTAVVVVQHLMGLAVAVMAYAVLCRAGLPAWASALTTLPVLYDAYQVELEHLLMSETLFMFLIAAALTLLLWRVRDGEGPVWWTASAAGLRLGSAVLVLPAGAALVPPVLLSLLLRRRGWRPALALGAAAAVPIVAYALWFHSDRGTYALTTSDGIYLWGRTAQFADCAKIDPPPEQAGLCLDAATRAEHDPPGHLIWRGDVPPRRLLSPVVSPEANRTLRDFSVRAILAQPGDYLGAVGDGVRRAFSPHRYPYPTASTERLYHFPDRPQLFPGGLSFATRTGQPGTVLSDAMAYGRTAAPSEVVQPYADRMIGYQERWYLPGPATGAVFGLGAVAVIAARRRRREALMAWGTAATLLLFPIASADFDYRYVVPAVPFACLAVGLGLSTVRARAERDGSGRADAPAVTRWWGSRGSRRRDSDPATVP